MSTQVLSCMLGQEAGPPVRGTVVDTAMRRGPKVRRVYCSVAVKGRTAARSDHKLVISEEC